MKLTKKRQQIIDEAVCILRENMANYSTAYTNPKASKDYATLRIATEEREVFMVMFLDNRHRLIKDEIMFAGTINAASVYPREVVKRSLQLNAAALILAHNHPSGVSEPSSADVNITHKIQEACKLLDIRVLDHIIVGENPVSLAERGELHAW